MISKKNIKFKSNKSSQLQISGVSHVSKRSLNAEDFKEFSVNEMSQLESPFQEQEEPEGVPSIIKDVDNLFLAKARGKVDQSAKEQQSSKENTIKSILPLIGQLWKFIHRKLDIVKEKYQEDSDDEDASIPNDDVTLSYLQSLYTEIVLALGKEFGNLLLGNQTRELSIYQREFINEVYVNWDKQSMVLAYPMDSYLRLKNSAKDNVAFAIHSFTKIK